MFVSEILDEVIEVLGRCDRVTAFTRLTDAIQALQDEGDWNANIGYADIKACLTGSKGRVISLPNDIETPLAVAVNCRPVFMRDEFFQFHLNGDGVDDQGVAWAWDDRGFYPSFMDIICPAEVVAVARLQSDAGVIIRVIGWGADGNTLRTQLEDGTWIDGVAVAANTLADFPGGMVTPPGGRVFRRLFTTTPVVTSSSSIAHGLVTGALMRLQFEPGSSASPLISAALYYIRVTDDTSVSLHLSRLDARTGQSPVIVTSLGSSYDFTLTDDREVYARTKFLSADPLTIEDLSRVVFEATTLPTGLEAGTSYFIKREDATSFLAYPTLKRAEEDNSPINVSDVGVGIVARSLSPINPSTTLVFPVNHNLSTGNSVTARNAGGQLPSPLLAGVAYYVRSVGAREITLHASLADATASLNAIVLTTPGSGTSSIVKLIPATAAVGDVSNITAPGHGLNQPSGSSAVAVSVRTGTAVTSATISNGGSGYLVPPIVKFSGGAGSGALGTAVVTGGVVTSITIDAQGTGYTIDPTITLVPASGSIVQFSTTGALPDPITQSTAYRSESPMTTGAFTLTNANGRDAINITSLGTGSLFLNISRSFGIGFTARWVMDTTGYATGAAIRLLVQDGVLPTTSPAIDAVTVYYARVISTDLVEIYASEAEALASPSTTGRIDVTSLGSGTLFVTTSVPVTVVPRDSFLGLESSGYISNLASIRLTTDGTLPAPLLVETDYLANFNSDGQLTILEANGDPVVITAVGSGDHELVIERDMSVNPATSLSIPAHQFAQGDSLVVESTDALPSPLVSGTPYYARQVDANAIELYALSTQADNAPSTIGRITFTNAGSGEHRTVQELPAILVKEVTAIEKPDSVDFIALYAWDEGNSDSLSLLADMHPKENNPRYRRIRVGVDCANVRMRYRKRSIKITSSRDFINLDSRMAVVMMVKSQDLLRKNFFDESERYRAQAVQFLNKRNRAVDGPRAPVIQINADVTTVPDDVMVD